MQSTALLHYFLEKSDHLLVYLRAALNLFWAWASVARIPCTSKEAGVLELETTFDAGLPCSMLAGCVACCVWLSERGGESSTPQGKQLGKHFVFSVKRKTKRGTYRRTPKTDVSSRVRAARQHETVKVSFPRHDPLERLFSRALGAIVSI